MDLEIKGFIDTSFLDWDGKIVATVYVPFCNFKCPFCHNSGLIENPKQYDTIKIGDIKEYLIRQKDFIDGICLTGGEPCLHSDRGLFEFMQTIKGLGFQIKFDSNGTDPKTLKKVVDEKMADYIAMDIKGPLNERYHKLTGVRIDLDKIKESINIIMESGIDYEFRTTVVPTLLGIKDIEDIAKHIQGAQKYVLQQFAAEHAWDKSLREIKPYSKEKMEEMVKISQGYIENTMVRGIKEVT